jgi:hypothetical protein
MDWSEDGQLLAVSTSKVRKVDIFFIVIYVPGISVADPGCFIPDP